MARLRAQLAELEAAEQKKPAMAAQEEDEPEEPEFMLMAQPARDRDELDLRRASRRLVFPEDTRREDGPRRLHDGLLGPGMVYDCTAWEWQEPTAMERELAMGFMEDATAHPEVTEEERRRALERAMDLNVMHWLIATIRMYHYELRWEQKRDKAAAVQPPTERSAAKEALARAMLGEIQEHNQLQHERGHLLERRWVYHWEEEDERPKVYAEQADILLPRDREEEAVDKKREDFNWLEEVIERQRSRENYEQEFGSADFALMAAT
ncbi:unnamed protein product [Closterium sp. Naga37s-1]|nr:unnamed protein product [Closterium sp. Naga37s-1]